MKILAFLPRRNLQSRIERALGSAQFAVETAASVKDCMELAQAKSFEGIVVDSDSLLFGDVLALVAFLRHSNSDVALFACARYLDLEQRMRLFEVGADDYVNEPFFASEMAMRLRHSIRLRQAASGASTASRVNVLRSGDLELDLVPGTKRTPPSDSHDDSGARVELIVRRLYQRGRCVYQRSTKEGGSNFSSEVDSYQPRYWVYVHGYERLTPTQPAGAY
jgi:ActR/RegA family two-component response regulator